MSTDKLSKNKNNSVLHAIFEHDVEAAAFIIVSMMLAASVTSYALDTSSVSNTNKRAATTLSSGPRSEGIIHDRNPVSANIQDVNNDGINDILITHKNGTREIIMTSKE